MVNDIIGRLRFLGTGYVGTTRGHTATLMNEAADLIEALCAENNQRIALLERWVLDDWLGGTDETIFVDTLTALGLDECDTDILSLTEKE